MSAETDFRVIVKALAEGDEDGAYRVFVASRYQRYNEGYEHGLRRRQALARVGQEPPPQPKQRAPHKPRKARVLVRKGYLGDHDPIEVETVLLRQDEPGIGRGLSQRDKIIVSLELQQRGKSIRATARTLGTTGRTVSRYRRQGERVAA